MVSPPIWGSVGSTAVDVLINMNLAGLGYCSPSLTAPTYTGQIKDSTWSMSPRFCFLQKITSPFGALLRCFSSDFLWGGLWQIWFQACVYEISLIMTGINFCSSFFHINRKKIYTSEHYKNIVNKQFIIISKLPNTWKACGNHWSVWSLKRTFKIHVWGYLFYLFSALIFSIFNPFS